MAAVDETRAAQGPVPATTPPPTTPEPSGAGFVMPAAVAAAAASGATAAAVGAGAALSAKAAGRVVSETIAAMRRFFAWRSENLVAEIVALMQRDHPERPVDELERLAREELAREREFVSRMAKRLRADLPDALRTTDPAARLARVSAVVDRERRYIAQRERAMVERAVGSAEWASLRESSPEGAVWMLGPAVKHTAECVALAGKAWPHEVLESVRPPIHAGCRCWLMGLREAVAQGVVPAGTRVPDAASARKRVEAMMRVAHDLREAWDEGAYALVGEAVERAGDGDLALVEIALRARGGGELTVGRGPRGRGGFALKVWDESWVIRNRIGQFAEWVKRIPIGGVGRLNRHGASIRRHGDGTVAVVDADGVVIADGLRRIEEIAAVADQARVSTPSGGGDVVPGVDPEPDAVEPEPEAELEPDAKVVPAIPALRWPEEDYLVPDDVVEQGWHASALWLKKKFGLEVGDYREHQESPVASMVRKLPGGGVVGVSVFGAHEGVYYPYRTPPSEAKFVDSDALVADDGGEFERALNAIGGYPSDYEKGELKRRMATLGLFEVPPYGLAFPKGGKEAGWKTFARPGRPDVLFALTRKTGGPYDMGDVEATLFPVPVVGKEDRAKVEAEARMSSYADGHLAFAAAGVTQAEFAKWLPMNIMLGETVPKENQRRMSALGFEPRWTGNDGDADRRLVMDFLDADGYVHRLSWAGPDDTAPRSGYADGADGVAAAPSAEMEAEAEARRAWATEMPEGAKAAAEVIRKWQKREASDEEIAAALEGLSTAEACQAFRYNHWQVGPVRDKETHQPKMTKAGIVTMRATTGGSGKEGPVQKKVEFKVSGFGSFERGWDGAPGVAVSRRVDFAGVVDEAGAKRSATAPAGKRYDRPPTTWKEVVEDAFGRADELAKRFGARNTMSQVVVKRSANYAGQYQIRSGRVTIETDGKRALEKYLALRAKGEETPDSLKAAAYGTYTTIQHEINHAVRGKGAPGEDMLYADEDGTKPLEEALTEESARLLSSEWLNSLGLGELNQWADDNPEHYQVVGSYTQYRRRLKALLDEARVPDGEREEVVLGWKFGADSGSTRWAYPAAALSASGAVQRDRGLFERIEQEIADKREHLATIDAAPAGKFDAHTRSVVERSLAASESELKEAREQHFRNCVRKAKEIMRRRVTDGMGFEPVLPMNHVKAEVDWSGSGNVDFGGGPKSKVPVGATVMFRDVPDQPERVGRIESQLEDWYSIRGDDGRLVRVPSASLVRRVDSIPDKDARVGSIVNVTYADGSTSEATIVGMPSKGMVQLRRPSGVTTVENAWRCVYPETPRRFSWDAFGVRPGDDVWVGSKDMRTTFQRYAGRVVTINGVEGLKVWNPVGEVDTIEYGTLVEPLKYPVRVAGGEHVTYGGVEYVVADARVVPAGFKENSSERKPLAKYVRLVPVGGEGERLMLKMVDGSDDVRVLRSDGSEVGQAAAGDFEVKSQWDVLRMDDVGDYSALTAVLWDGTQRDFDGFSTDNRRVFVGGGVGVGVPMENFAYLAVRADHKVPLSWPGQLDGRDAPDVMEVLSGRRRFGDAGAAAADAVSDLEIAQETGALAVRVALGEGRKVSRVTFRDGQQVTVAASGARARRIAREWHVRMKGGDGRISGIEVERGDGGDVMGSPKPGSRTLPIRPTKEQRRDFAEFVAMSYVDWEHRMRREMGDDVKLEPLSRVSVIRRLLADGHQSEDAHRLASAFLMRKIEGYVAYWRQNWREEYSDDG